MWSGTSKSFVDLHPVGANQSMVHALDGDYQAGEAEFAGERHAVLWSRTATSVVKLHPSAGNHHSVAWAASGFRQGGEVFVGSATHAGLWSGSAESFVDLHPAGAEDSAIAAMNGNRQVGFVRFKAVDHAALWSGTVESFIDLHLVLGPAYLSSLASAVWTDGSRTYVAGIAMTSATADGLPQIQHAILWMIAPRVGPVSLSIKRTAQMTSIRWPASATEWNLQSIANLSQDKWLAVDHTPIVTNGERQVTLPADQQAQLFRLQKP
jgi:hypothetical protein